MAETELSPASRSALAAVRTAIAGMTDGELTWHPAEKWSAAGILEHLSLAYARTTERMKPLLQQQLPAFRRRTLRECIGNLIVLKAGFIPAGRRSPEALVPRGMNSTEAKIAIEEKLRQLDRIIDQCEKRFGDKKKVLDHNLLGPLSASEWRRFHCVHTLHHMKQIEALREKMSVTGSASL